jgi:VWFA-related protein
MHRVYLSGVSHATRRQTDSGKTLGLRSNLVKLSLMCARVAHCLLVLLLCVLCAVATSARQDNPLRQADDGKIYLDVVVTAKSGLAVAGLQQQDFTLLDNKAPQPIVSFQALRGREAPLEIVLVVDDVNTGLEIISYERSQIDKFLRSDGGRLAHPIALAFLTDSGIQVQNDFSSDGNALSSEMDQHALGLHSIRRSGGIYSAVERFQLSMDALLQLASSETARPGRKIVVWISPGWPLFSGAGAEEQMDSKQEQTIFNNVVRLSTLLRQGHITLYSIDPLGTADAGGGRAFFWQSFVKGISKPAQAQWGDLALQVLSTQSGGVALTGSNDITGSIERCLGDTQAYYEISFAPSLDVKPNEYHQLEVHVADRKLTARTRQGYYAQPSPR